MSFYYLISSLPEISPTMETSQMDFDETFDRIRRNLTKDDRKLLRYLIYPNDIKNLLSTLFHEYWGAPLARFKKPAIFNQEEITNYKLIRRNFPDFINGFLAENEDRLANMSMQEVEDDIMELFYYKVYALNYKFLTEYYNFIRSLKAIVAAFHFNTFSFLSQPNIVDADRLILQIGPDRAPSALVSRDYPYLEELIKVLSENHPEKTQRFIDNVIWNYLNETANGVFSRNAVFSYTIKLQLLQRWHITKTESDEVHFEQLLHKIINTEKSAKIPVI
jgi:hypothetical protein